MAQLIALRIRLWLARRSQAILADRANRMAQDKAELDDRAGIGTDGLDGGAIVIAVCPLEIVRAALVCCSFALPADAFGYAMFRNITQGGFHE